MSDDAPKDVDLSDDQLAAARADFESWRARAVINTVVSSWQASLPPQPRTDYPVEIVPGGFMVGARKYDLTGKPLDMLRELVKARNHELLAADLWKLIWPDDTTADPGQAVKDTAKKLRKALREPFPKVDDPLPSSGKLKDLAYRLNLPR
jgi:hypothetical protein